MNEYLMYKLLDLINKRETISVMFKLGYSYSSIIKGYSYLEELGYTYTGDDISKTITKKGKVKLIELEKKYRNKSIGKLEQYKIKPMTLDEIYLP